MLIILSQKHLSPSFTGAGLVCHYSKLNSKHAYLFSFILFEATICSHELVTCQNQKALCRQTRRPETNSELLIWLLVQTSVAVGSLEWASVVSACLPAPSRAGFFDPR